MLKDVGVSPAKQAILQQLGITSIESLLHHFPIRFEIFEATPFENMENGQHVVMEGVVDSAVTVSFFAANKSRLSFSIQTTIGSFKITVYNRHFMRPHLKLDTTVCVIGKVDMLKRSIVASEVKLSTIEALKGIHPVYASKKGLNQKNFRKYLYNAITLYVHRIDTFVPKIYCDKYRLISKVQALRCIHFPKNNNEIKQSYRYLKYEEFLKFQLVMQTMKKNNTQLESGLTKTFDEVCISTLIKTLPYQLTVDQKEVLEAILKDMKSSNAMYRLLQGDVGSGKTVVACLALYANYLAGFQGAFMAPTEILAKQHIHSISTFFKNLNIKISLLSGQLKAKEKESVYQALQTGDIDIIIGTHALIQEKVIFKQLGLVITDEQHRFGVKQRKTLKDKGRKVDFLLMSATPIPRTLALSAFGDMDVSTIKTLPVGRKPIITHYLKTGSIKKILKEVVSYLKTGGQVYVICPLVEESETLDYRNAQDVYHAMETYFNKTGYQVGLMHGRMKEDQKDEVMAGFKANKIQVLVSTTVVEVGVDVGNANYMIIYDAHRFGLSTLHQLRGRIGRSDVQGVCYLLSKKTDPDVETRLSFIASTQDGFEISKFDLQRRGPGEVLGERQSGVPTFALANVVDDFNILEIAREDAIEILAHINEYLEIDKYIQTALSRNIVYID